VGVADAVAAPRLLDLDDVGAHVAEERRAPGPRRLMAHVDDADARERSAGGSFVHACRAVPSGAWRGQPYGTGARVPNGTSSHRRGAPAHDPALTPPHPPPFCRHALAPP